MMVETTTRWVVVVFVLLRKVFLHKKLSVPTVCALVQVTKHRGTNSNSNSHWEGNEIVMFMKHRGFETGYSQKMPLRNQECKDDIPFDSWAPSYFICTNSFSQGARLPKAKHSKLTGLNPWKPHWCWPNPAIQCCKALKNNPIATFSAVHWTGFRERWTYGTKKQICRQKPGFRPFRPWIAVATQQFSPGPLGPHPVPIRAPSGPLRWVPAPSKRCLSTTSCHGLITKLPITSPFCPGVLRRIRQGMRYKFI